ncbi:hypothetical protein F4782DRAFT_487312 [Xylaria castorea]|nr:hypothetical protein F4782DRAFT_487312 [Xylaria castorea]
MGRFGGKTAIVTGAGSGMGREVAEQLASEGGEGDCSELGFPRDKARRERGLLSSTGGTT